MIPDRVWWQLVKRIFREHVHPVVIFLRYKEFRVLFVSREFFFWNTIPFRIRDPVYFVDMVPFCFVIVTVPFITEYTIRRLRLESSTRFWTIVKGNISRTPTDVGVMFLKPIKS